MKLNKYWHQIISSLPDGITITDKSGKVLFVSDRIVQLFGAETDKDIIGTNLINWIHPEDQKKAAFYIKNAAEGISTSGAAEYRMIRKDKTYLFLESKGRVFKDRNQNILGMIYSSRDITERKKLEQSQLLKSKHESMEALAGSIAHDFNNILTVLKGQMGLIKSDISVSDEIKSSVLEAETAINQAKELTNQLISIDNNGYPNKTVFSVNKMLEEIVNLYITAKSKIKCNFIYSKPNYTILADKGQINRVLGNLIINAKESMKDGGSLFFKIKTVYGYKHKFLDEKIEYLSISIKDTGSGISSEALPKIFDPYFSTKSRGSGLGLFSAFSIIQNHNGHLTASSKESTGSTFTVFLPVI